MPNKCGSKKDEMREDWREMHKRELHNSYCYKIILVECTEKFLFKTLQKRDNLNDLGMEGKTTTKYILKKPDGLARTRVIWFRIGSIVGTLRYEHRNSCLYKNLATFCVAE